VIILRSNYDVLSAVTITDGYSWDKGEPTISKVLTPRNNYVTGNAPYTKVTFKVTSDVLAPIREDTEFVFDFNDYYSETKTLTSFLPRLPFHPHEDKYGIVWAWYGLSDKPAPLRQTLIESINVANEVLRGEEDQLIYSDSEIELLSAVPPLNTHLMLSALSSVLIIRNDLSDDLETLSFRYQDEIVGSVLYEKWPYVYTAPPNLLAPVYINEQVEASTPTGGGIPNFNRQLYTISTSEQPLDFPTSPTEAYVLTACKWFQKIVESNNGYDERVPTQLNLPTGRWYLKNDTTGNVTPINNQNFNATYNYPVTIFHSLSAPSTLTTGIPLYYENLTLLIDSNYVPTIKNIINNTISNALSLAAYTGSDPALLEQKVLADLLLSELPPNFNWIPANTINYASPTITETVIDTNTELTFLVTLSTQKVTTAQDYIAPYFSASLPPGALYNRLPNSQTISNTWIRSMVDVAQYTDYIPNSTACLSARIACDISNLPSRNRIKRFIQQEAKDEIPVNDWFVAGIFVKPIKGITKVRLEVDGTCFPLKNYNFTDWDLQSETLLAKGIQTEGCTLKSFGNGWYYIGMSQKARATGKPIFRFYCLKDSAYTYDISLSASFVEYSNFDTYPNEVIRVAYPQIVYFGATPDTTSPLWAPNLLNRTDQYKVHRISWYFRPFEDNVYYFWLGSDTNAVLLYGEAEFENDLQDFPQEYLLCRNDPAYGNQTYPEQKTHWDQQGSQTRAASLFKDKVYYFEARWWQQHPQSYIDVGWTAWNSSWVKVKWSDTNKISITTPKVWSREGYSADAYVDHIYTVPQIYSPGVSVTLSPLFTADYIYDTEDASYESVELTETSPNANFATLSTEYGFSPIEIEFSPKSTVAGSFPIERIDWNFGDGSPTISISRHTTLTSQNNPDILYKPLPGAVDFYDPRNYHVKHTYSRTTANEPSVYYPSLTAYSSVTNIKDSCSREIGPIALKSRSKKDILSTKFYDTNNNGVLVLSIDNKAALLRKDDKYIKKEIPLVDQNSLQAPNRVIYYNDFGTVVATNSGQGYQKLLML
jgi:hypothetical protein